MYGYTIAKSIKLFLGVLLELQYSASLWALPPELSRSVPRPLAATTSSLERRRRPVAFLILGQLYCSLQRPRCACRDGDDEHCQIRPISDFPFAHSDKICCSSPMSPDANRDGSDEEKDRDGNHEPECPTDTGGVFWKGIIDAVPRDN